jgi:hypothetical protein
MLMSLKTREEYALLRGELPPASCLLASHFATEDGDKILLRNITKFL